MIETRNLNWLQSSPKLSILSSKKCVNEGESGSSRRKRIESEASQNEESERRMPTSRLDRSSRSGGRWAQIGEVMDWAPIIGMMSLTIYKLASLAIGLVLCNMGYRLFMSGVWGPKQGESQCAGEIDAQMGVTGGT